MNPEGVFDWEVGSLQDAADGKPQAGAAHKRFAT